MSKALLPYIIGFVVVGALAIWFNNSFLSESRIPEPGQLDFASGATYIIIAFSSMIGLGLLVIGGFLYAKDAVKKGKINE